MRLKSVLHIKIQFGSSDLMVRLISKGIAGVDTAGVPLPPCGRLRLLQGRKAVQTSLRTIYK